MAEVHNCILLNMEAVFSGEDEITSMFSISHIHAKVPSVITET